MDPTSTRDLISILQWSKSRGKASCTFGCVCLANGLSRSQTTRLQPQCIIAPGSSSSVSDALKLLDTKGAKFSVRSGGHNANSGFSSIDSTGVLLDLSRLKQLSISQDLSDVQVGPGNSWGDVYKYMDGFSLSVAGKGAFPWRGRFAT